MAVLREAMINPHFEILDRKRKKLLPHFRRFKDRFYLAGGTALALQLAHRDSIDFDFFSAQEFSSEELLRELKEEFKAFTVEVVQAGNMTLNIIVAGEVKASFFRIKDKVLKPLLDFDYFNVASLEDIACMKIAALLRAEYKDYVDLYYLLGRFTLKEMISNCEKKYDGFNAMVYLKALVSFDDINITKMIMFKPGKKIDFKTIKKKILSETKQYF